MKLEAIFSNGVHLKFSGKPSAAIRSALKTAGYRWQPVSLTWWKPSAAGAAEFVNYIKGQLDKKPVAHDDPGYIAGGSYVAADRFDLDYEDGCRDACGL